ncbi:MAG TPA: cyanase [Polyangiales bacterium]|nr:cyanase [Polyangiales bacterium]
MTLSELSKKLLDTKKEKGLTWTALSKAVGMSEVWLATLFYGEASATPEIAKKVAEALDLGVASALTQYTLKGASVGPNTVPTDPFLYRFYEIIAVFGFALKDVIQEKFGDGIMSAVDFTMDVQKVEDPKGDRVLITMSGKFLPYKRW